MVLTLLVGASCGDDSSNPLSSTSTLPESATAVVTTTTPPTTTTLPPTTTTTVDPFIIDIYSIDPTPPAEPPTGVNALLGGPPDEITARVLLTDLEADGIDLTGVTIVVWPILSTGEALVVIEFGETALAYAEEDDPGTALIESILTHPLIDAQNITRLVMRIAGTDEEGPYVFTMTVRVDDMRHSLATGESLEEGQAQFELVRVEP